MGKLPSASTLETELSSLIGSRLPKPAGTTAGHAAGLPFEDLIHGKLTSSIPNRVLRQFEALNSVLLANPRSKSYEDRLKLLGPNALQFLLKRGKDAMTSWTPNNQFEVKQDDTAESIIFAQDKIDFESSNVILLDVKTQDTSKKAQAPNIISSDKLARAAVMSIQDGNCPFDIFYAGVKWHLEKSEMVCEEVRVISLMKIPPEEIYINFVAAQQIQFHPFQVNQTFTGDRNEWCRDYVATFCSQLERRLAKELARLNEFRNAIS